MRQLLPEARVMDLDDLYRGLILPEGEDRPWVALGMVATLDGAASLEGDTSRLGGDADRVAFRRLRDATDAILVGAETVRVEGYHPPTASAARRADRSSRNLTERPRLVIVTRSAALDPEAPAFSDVANRPIIVTCSRAPADRLDALDGVADVLRAGDESVDLGEALRHLTAAGIRRVLCEGGPSLNGSLLGGDLVDEIFLTVTPDACSGSAGRIIRSEVALDPRGFEVRSIHEHDGELILRYCRNR